MCRRAPRSPVAYRQPWERRSRCNRRQSAPTPNMVRVVTLHDNNLFRQYLYIASEASTKACTCNSDGPCNCWTPRAPRNRRPSKASHKSDKGASKPSHEQPHQPAALVATAHTGDYRPVLPRPSSGGRSSPPRSSHSPAGTAHGARAELFFSPYGRAYEHAHGTDVAAELPTSYSVPQQQIPSASQLLPNPVSQNYAPTREDMSSFMSDWLSTVQQQPNPLPPPPPSILCDCGPNCACPGCVVHQGASAVPQGLESCTNPSTCNACLECTMLALAQSPSVDEWLRQLNSNPNAMSQANVPSPNVPSPSPQDLFNPDVSEQQQQSQSDVRFDPTTWQSYALWSNLQGQMSAPSPPEDCCSGQCKCPQGMCACPADCCGCCQGCTCSDCTHQDPSMGTGKTLTFAVSGERGGCCGGRKSPQHQHQQQPQAGPSSSTSRLIVGQGGYQELDLRGVYEWSSPSSEVPRVSLSRASSSSSRSSASQHSHVSSHGSVHRGPAPADASVIKSCCASLETMNTSAPPPQRSPIPYPPPPSAPVQERTYEYDANIDSARMF